MDLIHEVTNAQADSARYRRGVADVKRAVAELRRVLDALDGSGSPST